MDGSKRRLFAIGSQGLEIKKAGSKKLKAESSKLKANSVKRLKRQEDNKRIWRRKNRFLLQ